MLLAVAELASFAAVGITSPSLPLYVTGPVGSDEAEAGLAFGAFALTALLLRPVVGRLVDRVGRDRYCGRRVIGAVGLALSR